MFGIALIVLGAIFLLKNLGLLAMVNWDIVWPVVLIAVGLSMIAKKNRM